MKKLSEEKLKEIKGGFGITASPFINFTRVGTREKKNKFNWRKIFGI